MSNRTTMARLAQRIAEQISELQALAELGGLEELAHSLVLVEIEARQTARRLMPLRVLDGGTEAEAEPAERAPLAASGGRFTPVLVTS